MMICYGNSYTKVKSSKFPLSSQNSIEPTYIHITLKSNYSIAWIESYLIFNITTDGKFNIYYNVYGIGINNLKVIPVSDQPIQINPGENIVKIPIKASFDAFPGKYQYNLIIYYFNESEATPIQQQLFISLNNEFKLALGVSWLLIILGIFILTIFPIVFREEKLKKEGVSVSVTPQVYTPSFQTQVTEVNQAESTRPGYIRCPDCKKEVKEGSSFCPECGYHIPKFLRTSK